VGDVGDVGEGAENRNGAIGLELTAGDDDPELILDVLFLQ
jgi:hypothetical protein